MYINIKILRQSLKRKRLVFDRGLRRRELLCRRPGIEKLSGFSNHLDFPEET